MSVVGLEFPAARSSQMARALVDRATRLLDQGWRPLFRANWDSAAKQPRTPQGQAIREAYRRYFDWYQRLRLLGPSLYYELDSRAMELQSYAAEYERMRESASQGDGRQPAPASELVPPPEEADQHPLSWLDGLAETTTAGATGLVIGVGLLALLLVMRGGQRA